MTWGVGGLNIDGTRIGTEEVVEENSTYSIHGYWQNAKGGVPRHNGNGTAHTAGRWPANVILDEDAAKALDMQSGVLNVGPKKVAFKNKPEMVYDGGWSEGEHRGYGDKGGASRFFYTAKASKAEREAGLDAPIGERANIHTTVKPLSLMRYLVRLVTPKGGKVLDPFMGSGSTGCASILEGFDFVGIDITPEYVAIAQKRIDHYAVTSPLEGF
jgi:site-specific DNA-methyltransferase (adenine-specific)